eukprot:350688-Chlamydomonas_euryale.AAC.8
MRGALLRKTAREAKQPVAPACSRAAERQLSTALLRLPAEEPQPGTYVGCYDSAPAFDAINDALRDPGMSVSTCDHVAVDLQYKLYMLQGGDLCMVSNDLGMVTAAGQASGCTIPCAGNTSQACGEGSAVL